MKYFLLIADLVLLILCFLFIPSVSWIIFYTGQITYTIGAYFLDNEGLIIIGLLASLIGFFLYFLV